MSKITDFNKNYRQKSVSSGIVKFSQIIWTVKETLNLY